MTELSPGEDFRFGNEPEYPEPPIEEVLGMSQDESDAMNRGQTMREAEAAGRIRGRILAEEEKLRQRYAHDAFPDAAKRIRENQTRRRQQGS